MKLNSNRIDELNISLSLEIKEADYAEGLKKKLSARRRSADIKGFRKGMAPASLIEKFYGPQSRSEAVNDLISKSLQEYIEQNNLNIIGEPLPAESQPAVDWEKDVDFTFDFDIALAPEINLEVSKDDSVTYYNVLVDDKDVDTMKQNLLRQYGELVNAESVEAEDFFIADFEQGETKVEGTYVSVRNISEASKPSILGRKSGEIIDVNINEWFENETDRASMLKMEKGELEGKDPMYKMTIKDIKRFVPAEENQETFDKIFGEGQVKDAEGFRAKVAERLAAEYEQDRDFRFMLDVKEYLLEKAAISLPEKFLKRWIFFANDGKFSMEDIEKEFDLFLKDFRWQMIRGYFMKKFEIKVEKEDLIDTAKKFAAYQFAMYGINNAPEEQLRSFAEHILSQEKESHRVYEKCEDDKCIAAIKEKITLAPKDITISELRELNG